MIGIDATRMDLVEAVRRNPLGPHSPEVQDLLALLRGDKMANRIVIVTVKRGREWAIGRLPGGRYRPIEILDLGVFTDPAEAEWTVFKLRWQEATGVSIDDPNDARSIGAGKPEPLRKSVLGYCDPWNAAPGERIAAKVSSETGQPYRASIIRIDKVEGDQHKMNWIDGAEREGRRRRNALGSWLQTPHHEAYEGVRHLTVSCLAFPTLVAGDRCCLISKWAPATHAGFALELDEDMHLVWRIGAGTEIRSETPVPLRAWSLLWGCYDSEALSLSVGIAPVKHGAIGAANIHAQKLDGAAHLSNTAPVLMAALAAQDACIHLFNGKLDRPRIAAAALGVDALRALHQHAPENQEAANLIAAWNFSAGIGTDEIHDIGPHGLHGRSHNLPSRGVKGADWTGDVHDWRFAPQHYSAIHFHEDDLADAGWPSDFEIEVPSDAESGVYALRLETKDDVSHAPIFVRPPRGHANASLAFLASTATYSAYINYRFHLDVPWNECSLITTLTLGPEDLYIQENAHVGLSAYDAHADGSGVRNATRKRPALDLDPLGGGLWTLGADAYLIAWLKQSGHSFDVVTDEDLHREGASLLERYRCIVTSSHPEYWSTPMWRGLDTYLQGGGRLMYMGGNGFYWRIGFHAAEPGAIEVRRTEGGARYWAEEPGEYVLESAAQLGGLWRRVGEPSNALVGVTTRAIGFGPAGWFVATQAARDPRASFIFRDVDLTAPIGAFGLLGAGVVGSEIDAADPALGTPAHALIIATSAGIVSSTMPAPEEMLMPHSAIHGGVNPAVRADMVFFETPNGGAVWSASTLNWASSISHNSFDNNVARVSANVLNRFLDAEPFAYPPAMKS